MICFLKHKKTAFFILKIALVFSFCSMNFSTIKNIIFDLGDVIINIDPPRTYQAYANLMQCSLQEAYQVIDNEYRLFERYDRGEFTDQEFIAYTKSVLKLNHCSDQQIVDAWNALLLDMPKERIERIQALSKSYNLYLLSNTTNIHIIEVNNIMHQSSGVDDLKKLFIKAYYSFDMKMRKPDEEIYTTLLNDANIKAEESVFLDDSLPNIIAAEKVGIKAIHVQKPITMLDYLKDA